MMNRNKKIERTETKAVLAITAASLIMLASHEVSAHTRLTVSKTKESSAAHGTTTTAVNIPHGCGDNSVIGNVFFLPDTNANPIIQTSSDNFATVETLDGASALDYIVNAPFIRLIKSRDVFDTVDFINDPLGNPIGFWAAGGEIPARNWVGQMPMNITAVAIQPASCAARVVFVPAIANPCKMSSMAQIDGKNAEDPNVDFWTSPDAGSKWDSPNWTYPATFTVERDLENNPLPSSCGTGVAVRIFPSAAQLDRDMPVRINGQQVWPLP
ncbi:MAG: hypothetical protein LV471_04835 [Nitrosomonas sp.]|nr:hypothetical protein [Nitrosomonas sp.]